MVNNLKALNKSQLYEVSNTSSITSNGKFTINLETSPYDKFIPFNFVLIQNNSSNRVRLIINDSIRKIIPAGTIQTFDSSTIPAIWSIRVQNLGATAISSEDIQVSFQKVSGISTRSVKLLGWDI